MRNSMESGGLKAANAQNEEIQSPSIDLRFLDGDEGKAIEFAEKLSPAQMQEAQKSLRGDIEKAQSIKDNDHMRNSIIEQCYKRLGILDRAQTGLGQPPSESTDSGIESAVGENGNEQVEIASQTEEFLSGRRQFMGINAQKVIGHLIDSGQTQAIWDVLNGKLGKFNSEHERNNLRPNYNSFAVVAFDVLRDKNSFDDAEKILDYWRDHKDEISDNNFDFNLNARSFELVASLNQTGLRDQAEKIITKMTEGDIKESAKKLIDVE